MNDLLERFFELENRQRIVVCTAAVVMVFGAYWWFVFAGRRAETTTTIARRSGLNGLTVRVLPSNPDLTTQFLPGLITWAQTE